MGFSQDPYAPASSAPTGAPASTAVSDATPDATNAEQTQSESAVPQGTVAELLEWVDDDPERAQAALDAELETDQPRTTLLHELQDIIDNE